MFTKLLKHEWQATKGILALLCVIILIAGIAIGSVMHYIVWNDQNGAFVSMNDAGIAVKFVSVACVFLFMAGVGAVAICSAGSLFFLIYRFYKRCFTDEGYLTFTLPVTTHQILLSSLVNTIIGELIMMVSVALAVVIAVLLFLTAFPENLIWSDVSLGLKEAFSQMWTSLIEHFDVLAAVTGTGIIAALSELIVLMLSVTIGAMVAKRHKILAAVAVYYGISIVQSFVLTFANLSVVFTENILWFFSATSLTSLIIGIGGYFLIHWLTDKKLNLT
ncbi:MAG: hypothetical protein IJE81_01260 [Oscillospiraceae bacterium]|nr:hypothetical protein [Oscillospiraceae bacterium]